MTFICATCGQEHDHWPPDQAAKRPDEIWAMSPEERENRVKEDDDLCLLDESRFFIRAVLDVPMLDRSAQWGLGLWVEVAKKDFLRYVALYEVDASNEPSFEGSLANALSFFPDAIGTRVSVKLGPASKRPKLHCIEGEKGAIAEAQRSGMSDKAIHDALSMS